MKPTYPMFVLAACLCGLTMSSCNSKDPSINAENQRALGIALARITELEAEIAAPKTTVPKDDSGQQAELQKEVAQLKVELAEATAKITAMPTSAEITSKLAQEGALLVEQTRAKYPGATVDSYETSRINMPSFEQPFSCNVRMVLLESSKTKRTLYWTASANLKGEWKFVEANRQDVVNNDQKEAKTTSEQEAAKTSDKQSKKSSLIEDNAKKAHPDTVLDLEHAVLKPVSH